MKEPRWPVIEDAPTPYVSRTKVLPANLRDSLDRYARYGVPTGQFLRAVLENNLQLAIGHADWESLDVLCVVACYVYNCLPGDCWGSPSKVQAHIDHWLPISTEWFKGPRIMEGTCPQ